MILEPQFEYIISVPSADNFHRDFSKSIHSSFSTFIKQARAVLERTMSSDINHVYHRCRINILMVRSAEEIGGVVADLLTGKK